MLHFAIVELSITQYMNEIDGHDTVIKNHTIEAVNQKEAEEKINTFYEDKSDTYGTSYRVFDINFFEHIE